jgi:hypothetical protein
MKYVAAFFCLAVTLVQQSSTRTAPSEPTLPRIEEYAMRIEVPLCGSFPNGPKWVLVGGIARR